MGRDMTAEATAVFVKASSDAYCAAINAGKSHTDAESFAIGTGRAAEDAWWAAQEAAAYAEVLANAKI